MKFRVYLSFLLLLLVEERVLANYFTDDPPEDYHRRTTIQDCPTRFYKNSRQDQNELDLVDPIINGETARLAEFQFMVAIGWTTSEGIIYRCGGTLITDRFVLTAAHCTNDGTGTSPDTVMLGDINLKNSPEDLKKRKSKFRQEVKIDKITKHPQHRFSKKYHDIALISLATPVTFNLAVYPACLWLEREEPSDALTAIGFGKTGFFESTSPILLKATFAAISKDVCSKQFTADIRGIPEGIVEGQLCAGSEHQDTCQGDSGGPLLVKRMHSDNSMVALIVGIVAFGTPCINGSTGVYTRLASYRDWIEQEIGLSMDYTKCADRFGRGYKEKSLEGDLFEAPQAPASHVKLLDAKENPMQCGATLVDYDFAITSALCIAETSPRFILIESTNETVPIKEIHVHPNFESSPAENEIALLSLSKYLNPKNGALLPACIRRFEVSTIFERLIRFSAYYNLEKRWITARATRANECNVTNFNPMQVFCANVATKVMPAVCELDRGGPVSNGGFAGYPNYLYGVVSSQSKGCNDPILAARVSRHFDWIESVIFKRGDDRLIFLP